MSNFDQKFYGTVTRCVPQILNDTSSHKNVKKQLHTEKMYTKMKYGHFLTMK